MRLLIRGLGRFSGVLKLPFHLNFTPVDVDAQNNTLTAAQINSGMVVHTSVTAAGTVTTDTAANIISGVGLTQDGMAAMMMYVNDGAFALTFAGGTGVTIADAGQTIGVDEAAFVVFRRVSASAVTAYIIGA